MKKIEIIELIQETLNGGSSTPDIWKTAHPKVIEKYASMAFNTMFYTLFRKDLSNLELYSKWFDDIAVYSGSKRTSIIPIEVVQLPVKGDCVRDITVTGNVFDITFAPTTFLEYKRLYNLGTAGRTNIVGYNLNSNIIEYYGMPVDITSVNLYLLRSFEDFDRYESVPIPSGKDGEFISMITSFMQQRIPDLNNNNTKT